MKTYNYWNSDLKLETIEHLDSKNRIKIYKYYNRNTDLSSIEVYKKSNFNGLFIFYCNNLSNLDEIHPPYTFM